MLTKKYAAVEANPNREIGNIYEFISCDAEFVQLSSIFANRKIVIYSVMDCEVRDQVIDPHFDCNCGLETPNEPPLYLMHYDDVHFINPHYQSIRPKPNNNIKLPMIVNNLQQNVCIFSKNISKNI